MRFLSDENREEETPDAVYGASAGSSCAAPIDFHTPEFNTRDGLDDCAGDFRSFEPLSGVITADMRHQMERQSSESIDAAAAEPSAPENKSVPEDPAPAAGNAAIPVTVVSHGRTLIIGPDPKEISACGELLQSQGLDCTLLVARPDAVGRPSPYPGGLSLREVNGLSITGAFGSFSAAITAQGGQERLTERPLQAALSFDLVLDLQPVPSYAGAYLPLGYYAPGSDPARLNEALLELPAMKGRFTKPRFATLLKHRCLHGRSRTRDCRRCLDACPFGAIDTSDGTISINQYMCQGCGGCALVCPADAVRMAHPSREETLRMIAGEVERQVRNGSLSPTIVFFSREDAPADVPGSDGNDASRMIRVATDWISRAGLETVMTALSAGAGRVVVAYREPCPPEIREALVRQTELASAILQGLGMPPDSARCVAAPSDNGSSGKTSPQAAGFDGEPGDRTPAALPLPDNKGMLIRAALHRLQNRAGRQESWFPLPEGSPFGAVEIDDRCTLCMACASACPTGALSAGGDAPRLEFREAACHQCGICAETCPERAMRLLPRMLCNLDAADTRTALRKAEPLRCAECGVPFASPAIVARIQDKLAGHWMYADDRQRRRLRMCRTCRARDALSSQDVKLWNRL